MQEKVLSKIVHYWWLPEKFKINRSMDRIYKLQECPMLRSLFLQPQTVITSPLTITLLQDLNCISNFQRQAEWDGSSKTGNNCKKWYRIYEDNLITYSQLHCLLLKVNVQRKYILIARIYCHILILYIFKESIFKFKYFANILVK